MTALIGISGKRGSGKTSTTKLVIETLKTKNVRAIRCSFAHTLKIMCGALFDIPDELLYGDDGKKETLLPCGKTVRQVLQQFGAAGREIDPRVWLRGAVKFAKQSKAQIAIFDDLRYHNEADEMDLTVRLTRWNGVIDNHQSETDLDDYGFDFVVDNGSKTLQETATSIVNHILQRRFQ